MGFDGKTSIHKDLRDYSSAFNRKKLSNVFQEANLNG
tara:strand:+ start:68 stop:178 length:111 start_codon:yes stop_codon:yes gene_type:complete